MLIEHLNRQLLEREQQGLRRQRRTTASPCAPQQQVRLAADTPAAPLLNFCSNDYLGLASHPTLIQALADGAARYGVGSGASHLVSGHSTAHDALEAALADWLGAAIPEARALSFGSGYMANQALLTALGDAASTVLFTDKLNHASLIDGALLARAQVQRYPHNRVDRLAALLTQSTAPLKLIVTDAVFSMDGDLAPLPELLALAEAHDAWLILDDAHGLGILGPHGEGSLAHFGLQSERLILMGTLGKAMGTSGAFVLAHRTIIEWLVQTARPYIYTTASSPALAHATVASIALVRGDEGRRLREQLHARIAQLRHGLSELLAAHPTSGWQLMDSSTAIQPVLIGDNHRTAALGQALLARGFWVGAIRPPTVPVGTARLRITLSAAHTEAQVAQLLDALAQELAGASS
ncbi:MAG: 8-amino-7-oxononanoate synthase [Leptothrix sp. (in: b-proteobacteria)]